MRLEPSLKSNGRKFRSFVGTKSNSSFRFLCRRVCWAQFALLNDCEQALKLYCFRTISGKILQALSSSQSKVQEMNIGTKKFLI